MSTFPDRSSLRGEEPSNYANDPMAKLWQGADDRETGAEAVEEIRARRKNLGTRPDDKRALWHRGHTS